MLRFADVGFEFAGTPVLDGFDLEIGRAKLVVMLGRSGCGKTTALRLAAGLLAPARGRIDNDFKRTSFIFQEPRLLPWADALDNAALGLKALGMALPERRERAAALLDQFDFKRGDLGKLPRELSGGMAQRVAVARALAVDPDLVLMDEPFGALDAGLRREMQDMMRGEVERTGLAVLLVTHDVPEAVRLADRIVVLSPAPVRIAADLVSHPPSTQATVYEAAAALLRQADVHAALAQPHDPSNQRSI